MAALVNALRKLTRPERIAEMGFDNPLRAQMPDPETLSPKARALYDNSRREGDTVQRGLDAYNRALARQGSLEDQLAEMFKLEGMLERGEDATKYRWRFGGGNYEPTTLEDAKKMRRALEGWHEQESEMVRELAEMTAAKLPQDFETGRPVVVGGYHGSPSPDIGTPDNPSFSPEMYGINTGAPSGRLGTFASATPTTAGAKPYLGHQGGYRRTPKTPDPDVLEYRLRKKLQEDAIKEGVAVADALNDPNTLDYADVLTADAMLGDSWAIHEMKRLGIDPGMAENASTMYPLRMKFDNPYVHDMEGKSYRDQSYYDIIRKAKEAGHDGVIIKNTYDSGPRDNIYVSLKPENIRGEFAEYDPAKAGQAGLMYGAGGVGLAMNPETEAMLERLRRGN